MRLMLIASILAAAPACAGDGGTERQELVRMGTLAALAPLCGLREEGWAFDLRRAAIGSATRTARTDDPGLLEAPGSNLAVSTLSYAEAEALEDFAMGPGQATCGPLSQDPNLQRADAMVREFRLRKGAGPGS